MVVTRSDAPKSGKNFITIKCNFFWPYIYTFKKVTVRDRKLQFSLNFRWLIKLQNLTDMFDKWMAPRRQKYGPIYRSWVGSVPMVHISKPEHVQTIFRSNTETYKGAMYKFLQPWLGQGLISGEGLYLKRF